LGIADGAGRFVKIWTDEFQVQLPCHPETAVADFAVEAGVERDAVGDGGVGGETQRGGVALRGGAEDGEAGAGRAGEGCGHRPRGFGVTALPSAAIVSPGKLIEM
jgi:hypothetical protein